MPGRVGLSPLMAIFHRQNDDQPEDLVGVAYFQTHICIHTMWYKNEG